MNDTIQIERFPESRWEEYREIRLEGLKTDPEAFASSYGEELEFSKDVWLKRLQNAIFATIGGRAAGVITCITGHRTKVKHTSDINGFFVRGEYRNRGIGTMLLNAAIAAIKDNPEVRKINLSVSSTQKSAISLYLKTGFVKIGEATDQFLVNGKFSNEVFMELFIN